MNEYFQDEAEVHGLVRGFEKCTIDPAQFKHYQHLAVALWYVVHYPYSEASEKMRSGIQKLAAAYGKMGYHETITMFWLMRVRDFAATADPTEPICELANRLAAKYADKNVINEHYSAELLATPEAKSGWVPPDLKAL